MTGAPPDRRRAAWAALGLLAACSAPDYSAVREWGRTASLAASYRPAAEPAALAATPESPGLAAVAAEAGGIALRPTPSVDGGILDMQQVLSVYLAALATLASDGVLPFREDPFTLLSARLAGQGGAGEDRATGSQAAGEAAAALGALLRKASRTIMRAPETGAFVTEADPAVQSLAAALAAAVARLPDDEAGGRQGAAAADARLEAAAPDAASRRALHDLAAARSRAARTRADARAAYQMLLARLAEGHALLRAKSAHLSQEEVSRQVRAAEDRMRAAARLLPQVPPPAAEAARAPSAEAARAPAAPVPPAAP